MKKSLSLIKVLLTLLTFHCSPFSAFAQTEQVPSFPGAEGFGRYTVGGRGGKVIHVTTLDDDPDNKQKGTFRWACTRKEPRTIVFDVSGTIRLKKELKINGNVTIAGQTAPGDGICIADYPVIIRENTIIRFMRFRLGNRQVAFHEGDGLGAMDSHDIIVDHCSVSWSIDECLSVYGSKNLTVQWCIGSQSLRNSGHEKGAHGYGGNWGGMGASYHHNLLAHHESRCPRLGPRVTTQCDERVDMRNNVYYNWAGNGCYGGEGMNVNIVNCYYKPGPATDSRKDLIRKRIAALGVRTTKYTKHDTDQPNKWDAMWHVWGKLYINGNINPDFEDVTLDNWKYGVYNQVDQKRVDDTFTKETQDTIRLKEPVPFAAVTTHPTEDAYIKVLQYAGASLHRDWVDEMVVGDVFNRAGEAHTGASCKQVPGIIDSQEDNRPADAGPDWEAWPVLKSLPAPKDSDQDGMPDEWEKANGLNPDDPADGNETASDGYTNLEHYMNSLVQDIIDAQNEGGKFEGLLKF